MNKYLLVVWRHGGPLDPEVLGPFASETARVRAACKIRVADPTGEHILLRLSAETKPEAAGFADLELE